MTIFFCVACGTSYPEAERPPERCPICSEERQYVPRGGQAWISREALAAGHRNAWARHEPGLMSVQTVPAFAINQRAFLLRTPAGNVLWDCLALLDGATEELVRGLGGIAAVAVSHPHYYTAAADWAAAFGAAVHLHAADRGLGGAAGSGDPVLGGGCAGDPARGDGGASGRAFRRRNGAALGGRRGRGRGRSWPATSCR